MKVSLFGLRGLLSLAVAAALAASSLVEVVKDAAVHVYRYVRDGLELIARDVVETVAPKLEGMQLFQVQRSRAKEFHARIARRERPQITGSWRMCPSA